MFDCGRKMATIILEHIAKSLTPSTREKRRKQRFIDRNQIDSMLREGDISF